MTDHKRRTAVRQRRHCRNPALSFLVLLLILALALPGAVLRANENARHADFNIPPQSLDTALLVFSEQANVQIVAATETLLGLKTVGVTGEHAIDAALACLLKDTDLRITPVGRRTYVVAPAMLDAAAAK